MRKFTRPILFLALAGLLFAPQAGLAASSRAEGAAETRSSYPSFTMEHWKYSSKEEKMAFLFGFLSALEMEKEWQRGKFLPISKSTVGSWIKGLDGMTLDQIRESLDAYLEQNPDKKGMNVIEVLGRMYVRPKMTPAERKEAADHYARVRGDR